MKKLWNKIFGKENNEYKKVSQTNKSLYLWEDDYLMIELVSAKNKEFLDKETDRINEFGKENFDGFGFTDITVISDKPYELIEEQIKTSEIITIFENSDLKRVTEINVQDKGLLNQDELPLAFGNNNYAIIIEDSKGLIKNAYWVGQINDEKNLSK